MPLDERILVQAAGGGFCWKLESELADGEIVVKPWKCAVDIKDSAEIITDLEGYARRKFSVPEEVTVTNNYDYNKLLQAIAMCVFYSFGEAFRDAVEREITEEIGHWTGIC